MNEIGGVRDKHGTKEKYIKGFVRKLKVTDHFKKLSEDDRAMINRILTI